MNHYMHLLTDNHYTCIHFTINHLSELDCVARGSPVPSLSWMVRDRPVLSSYLVDVTVVDSDRVEKRIRIRGADKSHEGVYQCVASNNVGSVMKNSHVIGKPKFIV